MGGKAKAKKKEEVKVGEMEEWTKRNQILLRFVDTPVSCPGQSQIEESGWNAIPRQMPCFMHVKM
jgi:hypothetical protein